MAWNETPNRTTLDTNSAADINNKQDNEDALKGGTPATPPNQSLEELRVGTSLNEFKIGDGTDTDKDITAQNADANKPKLRYNKTTNKWQFSNNGTTFSDMGTGDGALPDQVIKRVASGFNYPTSNPMPLNTDGTNVKIKEQLADDSTDESITGQDTIANDLDTAGTVNIRIWCKAATAPGSSKNVVHILKYKGIGDTEDFDQALSSLSSGAKAIGTVTDGVYQHTFSASVASMNLDANDFFPFEIIRDADNGSDDLVGDLGYLAVEIRIPRA